MKSIFDRIPSCPHGSVKDVDAFFISSLMRLETYLGREPEYNSGYRCPECNAKAGGSVHSAHMKGLAVDIKCLHSRERFQISEAAYYLGFKRIGKGKTFIHLDVDTSLDQEVEWMY
jgi:uncharacterized protein YcbK (DUF882 family)